MSQAKNLLYYRYWLDLSYSSCLRGFLTRRLDKSDSPLFWTDVAVPVFLLDEKRSFLIIRYDVAQVSHNRYLNANILCYTINNNDENTQWPLICPKINPDPKGAFPAANKDSINGLLTDKMNRYRGSYKRKACITLIVAQVEGVADSRCPRMQLFFCTTDSWQQRRCGIPRFPNR